MNDFASRCAIAVVAATLAACGRNDGDPGWGCACDPQPDHLLVTAQTAGPVLFKTYRAYDALVHREWREHAPRQYAEGTAPACDSGSRTVQIDDKDQSGGLTTGDEMVVTFHQCAYQSANGLGSAYLDGALRYRDLELSADRDAWSVDTVAEPISYFDAISGPGPFGDSGFSYRVELVRGAASAQTVSIHPIANSGKYVSGHVLSFSAQGDEEIGDDGDTFSWRFSIGAQDYGVLQPTENELGFLWYAWTRDATDFGSVSDAPDTPLQGRFSENDGFPSSGSLRILNGISEPGVSALATLTAQGTDGRVLVEVSVFDGSVPGYVLQSSTETTWQALAAAAAD
ncbi:MAG TPA: hypothetical protein VFB36_14245 [Nevskiaceae bacterium]|nr:hypothetical protein [Nevskiaceae bacterium]